MPGLNTSSGKVRLIRHCLRCPGGPAGRVRPDSGSCVAPLAFARHAIAVAVHRRAGTVLDEIGGFRAGMHLAAPGAAVAAEWRAGRRRPERMRTRCCRRDFGQGRRPVRRGSVPHNAADGSQQCDRGQPCASGSGACAWAWAGRFRLAGRQTGRGAPPWPHDVDSTLPAGAVGLDPERNQLADNRTTPAVWKGRDMDEYRIGSPRRFHEPETPRVVPCPERAVSAHRAACLGVARMVVPGRQADQVVQRTGYACGSGMRTKKGAPSVMNPRARKSGR